MVRDRFIIATLDREESVMRLTAPASARQLDLGLTILRLLGAAAALAASGAGGWSLDARIEARRTA
jgi:hypothetical protein